MACALAMSVAAMLDAPGAVGPAAGRAATLERILAESSEIRSDRYVAITCRHACVCRHHRCA